MKFTYLYTFIPLLVYSKKYIQIYECLMNTISLSSAVERHLSFLLPKLPASLLNTPLLNSRVHEEPDPDVISAGVKTSAELNIWGSSKVILSTLSKNHCRHWHPNLMMNACCEKASSQWHCGVQSGLSTTVGETRWRWRWPGLSNGKQQKV